jgi:hypothetical protein
VFNTESASDGRDHESIVLVTRMTLSLSSTSRLGAQEPLTQREPLPSGVSPQASAPA